MKCKIIIDATREEEVQIFAHEKSRLVEDIEQLILSNEFELLGYNESEAIRLNLSDVCCFIIENNKVYAITERDKYQIKSRLYQLEERLPQNFVKINQSCIANIKMMERFDVSISGTLLVKFKNGYSDYVSRRNLKNVKERLGL